MKVQELANQYQWTLISGNSGLQNECKGCYCGDLLSDVMAGAQKNDVWITIQAHKNVLAVALLKEISAIVLARGVKPDAETIEKSNEEGIPVFSVSETSYQTAINIYKAL